MGHGGKHNDRALSMVIGYSSGERLSFFSKCRGKLENMMTTSVSGANRTTFVDLCRKQRTNFCGAQDAHCSHNLGGVGRGVGLHWMMA